MSAAVPLRLQRGFAFAWLSLLGACAAAPVAAPPPAAPPATSGGADADAHGCRASAGYEWCAKTGACERPWELVAREGIDHSASQVAAWCAAPR